MTIKITVSKVFGGWRSCEPKNVADAIKFVRDAWDDLNKPSEQGSEVLKPSRDAPCKHPKEWIVDTTGDYAICEKCKTHLSRRA